MKKGDEKWLAQPDGTAAAVTIVRWSVCNLDAAVRRRVPAPGVKQTADGKCRVEMVPKGELFGSESHALTRAEALRRMRVLDRARSAENETIRQEYVRLRDLAAQVEVCWDGGEYDPAESRRRLACAVAAARTAAAEFLRLTDPARWPGKGDHE